MHDTEGAKTFDVRTRERIRRKIVRYKEEYDIGVLRLAKRISKAHPQEPKIPIKTLQRFLTGETQTVDMYVGFFARFAREIPDPDPVGELGRSMIALYAPIDAHDLPGLGKFIVRDSSGNDLSELTIAPDKDFLRLKERTLAGGHMIFDGVMVRTGTGALAALKDRLMYFPKLYMLQQGTECWFGQGWFTQFDGKQTFPQVRLIRCSDG